jgi:hypothetical protein
MTDGARLFVQGIACGMAFYAMFDFISWMREE